MRKLYFFLLLAIAFLYSCSPKYKIEKVYIPQKADKECIEKCEKKREECRKECLKEKKKCLNEAIKRAKEIFKQQEKIYKERLKAYFNQYDRYLTEYRQWQEKYLRLKEDFQYYSRKCKIDKNWCDEKDYYKQLLDDWLRFKPKKPIKPEEPSFNSILEKQQSLCRYDCCCENEFDACFQSCGGKVKIKKICIENCD